MEQKKTLRDIKDRIAELPVLENKLTQITKRVREAEFEVSTLLTKLKIEQSDVENLERESFSSFVLRVFGKYDDKLERERQEQIEAKQKYDAAATHLEDLNNERADVQQRIFALRDEQKLYESALQKRHEQVMASVSEPSRLRLTELESAREGLISQKTEIREALSAADRVKSTAESALSSLKSADGWATYDIWGGSGIISHMAKYSHIDNAEASFNRLSSQIRTLRSELRDVQNLTTSGLSEISSGQRTVDFWFDNIFTDLSVRDQIRNNMGELSSLLSSVSRIKSVLNDRLLRIDLELTKIRQEQEELLLELGEAADEDL